jgi:hypothetical protein
MADNERLCIVLIRWILAAMGYGVRRPNVLSVVNNYILRLTIISSKKDSMKPVQNVISCHLDLAKIVKACSIDPNQAKSAIKKTRDAAFTKLENHIETVRALEKIPWKQFCDIQKESVYNMDKDEPPQKDSSRQILGGQSLSDIDRR